MFSELKFGIARIKLHNTGMALERCARYAMRIYVSHRSVMAFYKLIPVDLYHNISDDASAVKVNYSRSLMIHYNFSNTST